MDLGGFLRFLSFLMHILPKDFSFFYATFSPFKVASTCRDYQQAHSLYGYYTTLYDTAIYELNN